MELIDSDISGTERAVFGPVTGNELHAVFSAWVSKRLGSPIAGVRFRAGRIDVVWGVELEDGRAVIIKTHRAPVDLTALCAAIRGQHLLVAAGYPSSVPLAGPDEVGGRVLTAETLLAGATPNGRDPEGRLLLAGGLARHIEILREHPSLAETVGPGPAWCRYQQGPWPLARDSMVDLQKTVEGYEWLDALAQRAVDQIVESRDAGAVVVGHADWYAGNTVVSGHALVGTFDWELVADTEAVLAGFAAACYAASSTGGGGLSTPAEAAAFLNDYETARGARLGRRERRAATGATAWILAFNARWQVGLVEHGLCEESTLAMVEREDYLTLDW